MKKDKRILRVFVERTSMTPNDGMVRVGMPDFPGMMPDADEVHISVLFTWQMERAEKLRAEYQRYYKNVKIGGVPYGLPYDRFVGGMYLRKGITITTRGCNFNCPWCMIQENEGKFREINIEPGNELQDNNILLASKIHLQKVFDMLKTQSRIKFKGIDCRILKDWHIEEMRGLKVEEIWLAYDDKDRKEYLRSACERLKHAGFSRDKIRCYVLCGFNEPIQKAEQRLVFAYECGALPFIQVYRKPNENKKMASERSREDNIFVCRWSRPAAIWGMMKK